jgi:hypothetical protein
VCNPGWQLVQSQLGCDSRPDNGRDIFSAGTPTSFLNPTVNQADQARALIAIEHADTLRTVKSMGRKGEQADSHFLNVNRQPARARHRIDEQRNSLFPGELANFANRFDDADVVVNMMHAD